MIIIIEIRSEDDFHGYLLRSSGDRGEKTELVR